jgi:alpha-glucosidase
VWTGDNTATWEHLRISLPELMGMGISGLSLVGADIGGFIQSPSPDLSTRWLQAGVFYPYCRTHNDFGTRNKEPWAFGNEREDINRQSIELRYRLLPYFYNAFHQAAETGLPVMRALLLDYPDDANAISTQDEFLLGDDLLVAPVVKDGEISRDVYFPKGPWCDFWSARCINGPRRMRVDAPLDRIPIFVRGGAILPTQQVVQYTDQAPINPLTLEVYPQGESSRDYYEDDGLTFDYQRGVHMEQTFTAKADGNSVNVSTSARKGLYQPPARSLEIKIHGEHCAPRQLTVNGNAVPQADSLGGLGQAASGWYFDAPSNTVFVRTADRPEGDTLRLENQ